MSAEITTGSIELIFSSDPQNGAINITDQGSAFEVALQEPLHIPHDATNVKLKVVSSTIWWTIPNVNAGVNDIFRFDIGGSGVVTAIVPEGLYDMIALYRALQTILISPPVSLAPAYVSANFQLIADAATQRVQIYLAMAGDSIDVGTANSVFQLAGWPTGSPIVAGPGVTTAPQVAQFNQVDYFLIHSDLVSRGIRFNNAWTQTIAQVLIDVPPGSQIDYAPFNPPASNANELIGANKWNVKFWLTDSRNRPVNTFGEFWTARIEISYIVPVFIN
jgi:hypothetical protein